MFITPALVHSVFLTLVYTCIYISMAVSPSPSDNLLHLLKPKITSFILFKYFKYHYHIQTKIPYSFITQFCLVFIYLICKMVYVNPPNRKIT